MLEGASRARARETSCRWPWERLLPLYGEGTISMAVHSFAGKEARGECLSESVIV